MIRAAFLFKSSRIQNSKSDTSIILSRLETPTVSTNLRIASGVYPRRLRPEIVGILGSSQPFTSLCSTIVSNFRLLMIV